MNTKKGFTLIELVVVIVILGILAVTAAPKFLNLQSDARKATLAATKGALESAFQIFSAKAQLPSSEIINDEFGSYLVLNGYQFLLTDDFYPNMPIQAFLSLEPLLSIVNIDINSDIENKGLNYEFGMYNRGFVLYYGDNLDESSCYISYAPNKEHNTASIPYNGEYFHVVNSGC
ncbi:type II secretion system protein [Vibrio parahaemolyticus]|uniref:type II secretion system protein n=1 Tax=Vibrio parahaemolyticus TaxID=670 RepID=UPI0028C474C8|nr:type II secretion system protein [Vibrio parahaemolyticus]